MVGDDILCSDVTEAIKRFFKYAKCGFKEDSKVICIFPLLDDDAQLENFISNINNENSKVIFFSLYSKDDPKFQKFYKNWLFIIEHYATVIQVPVNVRQLKYIIKSDAFCKKWLKPKKIEKIYNKLRVAIYVRKGSDEF